MFLTSLTKRCFFCLLVLISLLCFFVRPGSAETVAIPLTLDERLLTSLLIESSFKGPGTSMDAVGREGDCMYVRLDNPHYRVEKNLLRLEVGLTINGGTEVGGKCLLPMSWQGYLVLWQRPVFTGGEFILSFKVEDSELLDRNKESAFLSGLVWKVVKQKVYNHLEQVRIDLGPPASHLTSFLGMLFKDKSGPMMEMLDTVHRGSTYVAAESLVVELMVEVEEAYQPEEVVAPFSREDRAEIIAVWEKWDAFLVYLMNMLAQGALADQDRQLMIDALLESRYSFSAALDDPTLEGDLVRKQFVKVWERLSPLFRNHLVEESSDNILGFLAFFTSADALQTFDALGPTFGIELSQEGLLYLARMLSGESTALPYQLEVDDSLREFFELKPYEQDESIQEELEEIDLPEEVKADPLTLFFDFLIPSAYGADESPIPLFAEILKWQVPADPYPEYVTRVREVLLQAATEVVGDEKIPVSLQGIYLDMIPAFAWQESCFRQFVVKKKKLTYLLSYNGTSVGLMQINERIWRGLYDRQRLRWDIHYNAAAGCEILALYLNRYVLRDQAWLAGDQPELLARVLYSMYNGGPGQYKKFLKREKSGQHYKSDLLFTEKLEWAMKKEWQNINFCLVGG